MFRYLDKAFDICSLVQISENGFRYLLCYWDPGRSTRAALRRRLLPAPAQTLAQTAFSNAFGVYYLMPRRGSCSHWVVGPPGPVARRNSLAPPRTHDPVAHRKGAQRSSSFTTSGWSAGTDHKECLNFFLSRLTQSGNLAIQLLNTSNSTGLQALLPSFPSRRRRPERRSGLPLRPVLSHDAIPCLEP